MRIGYFSRLGIAGPQEAIMQEGHALNVMWNLETSDVVDALGLENRYKGQVTFYNGRIYDFIKDSDLILFDYAYPRGVVNLLRGLCKQFNKPNVGLNSDEAVRLELDRFYAKQFAQDVLQLTPLEVHTFKAPEPFIEFVKGTKNRIVVKADKSTRSAVSTYIPFNNDDAIEMAKNDTFYMFRGDNTVTVEQFVEGYNVCIGGYFNGSSFGGYAVVDKEYKHALDGEMGNILTGEMGTTIQVVAMEFLPKRFQDLLKRLESFLFRVEYRGFIDVNLIVTENEIYMLEFTTRQGIPTECGMINLVSSYVSLLQYCSSLIANEPLFYDVENVYVTGCLACYGIPYELNIKGDIFPRIYGTENLKNKFQLIDAFYDKEGYIRHKMEDRPLLVHGKGKNINIAQQEYLSEIRKVYSWNCFYRKEIGNDWIDPIMM